MFFSIWEKVLKVSENHISRGHFRGRIRTDWHLICENRSTNKLCRLGQKKKNRIHFSPGELDPKALLLRRRELVFGKNKHDGPQRDRKSNNSRIMRNFLFLIFQICERERIEKNYHTVWIIKKKRYQWPGLEPGTLGSMIAYLDRCATEHFAYIKNLPLFRGLIKALD